MKTILLSLGHQSDTMAKEVKKKPARTAILRLYQKKLVDALEKAARDNKRSVNSEIEFTLEEKYL